VLAALHEAVCFTPLMNALPAYAEHHRNISRGIPILVQQQTERRKEPGLDGPGDV
jgi:hypothetical protein